jgi:hypothetical protein
MNVPNVFFKERKICLPVCIFFPYIAVPHGVGSFNIAQGNYAIMQYI